MSITPLKIVRTPQRKLEPLRPRRAPTASGIARRRFLVMLAKRVLPVAALLLLTSVALYPELSKDSTTARVAFRRGLVEPESGELTQAHYNGVDESGRRYTITADRAQQPTPDRINLHAPVGDLTLNNNVWLHGKAEAGVYMQQLSQLDLSGNVVLYRDDGITMLTDDATLDLKSDAAASASQVHVEGPFGTLDAQGFSLLDGGTVIQFHGPSRLVLNGGKQQ